MRVCFICEGGVCCIFEGHFIIWLSQHSGYACKLCARRVFFPPTIPWGNWHDLFLLVQMEEEEEERLRQPTILQELEPAEVREHRRSSRDHRERRGEAQQSQARPPHSDDDVEEGEGEGYDNDVEIPETKVSIKPKMRPITAAPSVSSVSANGSPNTPGDESPCGIIIPHENSPPDALPHEENRPKFGLSLKLGLYLLITVLVLNTVFTTCGLQH